MPNDTILVVADEQLTRWSLAERLRADGYDIVEASTGREAVERVADGVDLVLLDDELPDLDGVTVLRRIKELDPDVLVVLLTAFAAVQTAAEFRRMGADHVARKPFDLDEVSLAVASALEAAALRREVRRWHTTEARQYGADRIVGESAVMAGLREMLRKVALSPASTVLLTGESGTGKDLAAKVLHYNSQRANRPFVDVACSAIPDTLLERELFGHERGAFAGARQQRRGLFEQADGGTVYLDEIGEIPPALQAKLLRFLEERAFTRVGGVQAIEADVRVIAATNRNLEAQVKSGLFREDLYYRLNALPIVLPPLRRHLDDVPALVSFYVDVFNRELRKNVQGASPEALRELRAHCWPGNIREVRNAVERAMLLAAGSRLEPRDFPLLAARHQAGCVMALPAEGVNLEDLEHSLVVQALERSAFNQTRAGTLLGMNRDQIRYRIEKFGLTIPAHHGANGAAVARGARP